MKLPKEYEHLATQDEIEEWYDDAATNCCESMEEPTEEDIRIWAEFCVIERLKQIKSWYKND